MVRREVALIDAGGEQCVLLEFVSEPESEWLSMRMWIIDGGRGRTLSVVLFADEMKQLAEEILARLQREG